MKALSWVIAIILAPSLLISSTFLQGHYSLLIAALYIGILLFIASRPKLEEYKHLLKQIAIYSIIIIALLVFISLFIQNINNKIDRMITPEGAAIGSSAPLVSMFSPTPIWVDISIGLIIFCSALLIAWLNSITTKDEKGYRYNIALVVIYSLIFPVIYPIIWFYRVKKALQSDGEQLPSLWWFLIPIAGSIYLIVMFSQSLGRKTKTPFIGWLLIFLLLNGFDIIVGQAIINSDIPADRK